MNKDFFKLFKGEEEKSMIKNKEVCNCCKNHPQPIPAPPVPVISAVPVRTIAS